MDITTNESRRPISTLIGFFTIFSVILFSSFLLVFQLALQQDANTAWNDLLDGKSKFNYLVKTDHHNMGIKSDFFAHKRLMSILQQNLHRKKRVKKDIIVGFTAVVLVGTVIIWTPMLYHLTKCKMEKFLSQKRGIFLILTGSFFAICIVLAIIITVIIWTQDLDDHKSSLLKGLKLIAQKVHTFKPSNNNSITWDTNENGIVNLSPHTWFLIYMECLIAEGYTFSEILPAAKIQEADVQIVMNSAKIRYSTKKALVQIHETEYPLEWLRNLHFCPEKNAEAIGGLLLIAICVTPCIFSGVLWFSHGRRSSRESSTDGENMPRLVQMSHLVVGSNDELVEFINHTNDPNEESYIEEIFSPSESLSKVSTSKPNKKTKSV